MSRALWQSRRPVYGKFSHVIDLTVKHRNSMQQHQAKKKKNYNCFQVLSFKNCEFSWIFHHFPWTSYVLCKGSILSLQKQELIPSQWYDFIYSKILCLGYEKEHEEDTLVHPLFVHKSVVFPLVNEHAFFSDSMDRLLIAKQLRHHDFSSRHILSRLRPPTTRATVANIRRVMHDTERPPCNAKRKLMKFEENNF